MDEYRDIPKNPLPFSLLALVCGVAGVFIAQVFIDHAYFAIGLGAIGLFVGGYAISIANHYPGPDRMQFMLLAGVGLMVSVLAFMFGIIKTF
ncbi:MAG: hypothetical protein FWC44_01020 [Methanomassiliicoccaceae archaeon]|nr:hypothetical protein [Methanomassiliicoccaceae archaeon]